MNSGEVPGITRKGSQIGRLEIGKPLSYADLRSSRPAASMPGLSEPQQGLWYQAASRAWNAGSAMDALNHSRIAAEVTLSASPPG